MRHGLRVLSWSLRRFVWTAPPSSLSSPRQFEGSQNLLCLQLAFGILFREPVLQFMLKQLGGVLMGLRISFRPSSRWPPPSSSAFRSCPASAAEQATPPSRNSTASAAPPRIIRCWGFLRSNDGQAEAGGDRCRRRRCTRRLGEQRRFEGQGLDRELIASLRLQSGGSGHQVADHFNLVRRRRFEHFVEPSGPVPSQRTPWSRRIATDMRFTVPCGIRTCLTVRLDW